MELAHEPVQAAQPEVRTVDQEPHGPIDRGADERAVDHRDVVRDDERRALGRNVRAPDDADPVDRVGQHPQERPDGVANQPGHIVLVRKIRRGPRESPETALRKGEIR